MKRLLLDTHVLLWWLQDAPQLAATARTAIEEIAVKKKLGKLKAPDDLAEQLDDNAFEELPVTLRHGLEAAALPLHHHDPFDRLLIAQARIDGLTLVVTADQQLHQHDVPILPAS